LFVACNNPSDVGNDTCDGYTLTVSSNPDSGGTMSVTGTHCYTPGTVVNVTASLNDGYLFVGWSGALVSNDTTVSVLMNSSQILTANFVVAPNTIVDSRDRKAYRTATIGGQTWMAENLNYNASGSVCYFGNTSNCSLYGRLYDWATVMGFENSCNSSTCASQVQTPHRGICPSGWHVPSNAEWGTLIDFVGYNSGTMLKAQDGWSNNDNGSGNGTDDYGFSALPGGGRGSRGNVWIVGGGMAGYWWSSSPYYGSEREAMCRYMTSNYDLVDRVLLSRQDKRYMFSLRCVQDLTP